MSEPVSLNLARAGSEGLFVAPHHGTAVSGEAAAIRKSERAVAESRERSIALFGSKASAISEIRELVSEHAGPGWDGDGAEPISPLAAQLAVDLIRALPNDIPMPEFAPEPDGSISLDWIQSRSSMVSISAGETDRLAYAWLDGTDRGHAVARFDGERVPPRILDTIRQTVMPSNVAIRVA